MWTYGITYNVPIKYNYNKIKSSKALPKLKMSSEFSFVIEYLYTHLGSSIVFTVPEPLKNVTMGVIGLMDLLDDEAVRFVDVHLL
ncbi:hypothetical protein Tco_0927926 [Tanacetum coccineum]